MIQNDESPMILNIVNYNWIKWNVNFSYKLYDWWNIIALEKCNTTEACRYFSGHIFFSW